MFPFKSKVDIFVEIFVCIAKDRMMKEEHRTDKEKKKHLGRKEKATRTK